MGTRLKLLLACALLMLIFTANATLMTEAKRKVQIEATPAAPGDDAILKCPKCQHEMERGFLPDNQGGKYIVVVGDWALAPSRVHSGGNIVSDVYRKITAFRCKNCGFIEMYAK
ncbi:MAG: hypothetical protein JST89_01790 [Cyanobacteria bacterium SZAS-4]|nr:hypothetical protein [Cyanobacteria bacterium SZAS-4]